MGFEQTGSTLIGDQDVPSFTQTTTLTPEGQQQFDLQQQLALFLTQAAQNQAQFLPTDQFSLEGLPFAPGDQDFAAQRALVEQAQFDRGLNLLQPGQEQQQAALQENISQRGIPITGEDAGRLTSNLQTSQNQALENLALSSVLAGGGEQNRLFGLQQATRGQALQERQLERSTPFNELAAFLQGAPALQQPQPFGPVGTGIAPTDILGANALSAQIAQQNFQTQQAAQSAGLSSSLGLLGTLGGAALLSDKRLKKDIKPIGKFGKHNWYSFKYLWSNIVEFGVMAQEVLKTTPEAIGEIGGYYTVDYARL